MKDSAFLRPVLAEFLGTAFLLAVVVGSGIMGSNLSGGNTAIALLANTIATGAGLVVLITVFGPISGAHFNPAVTLVLWHRGVLAGKMIVPYILAQVTGGGIGVLAAHAMFSEILLQISSHARNGFGLGFSEFIATFGLIVTILGTARAKSDFIPVAVGLYITSAYWFTASTSFANPAVTIARMFSDTFAGIAPSSVPVFILCQIAGAFAANYFVKWVVEGTGDTKK